MEAMAVGVAVWFINARMQIGMYIMIYHDAVEVL